MFGKLTLIKYISLREIANMPREASAKIEGERDAIPNYLLISLLHLQVSAKDIMHTTRFLPGFRIMKHMQSRFLFPPPSPALQNFFLSAFLSHRN
jgi:hypothetical protein